MVLTVVLTPRLELRHYPVALARATVSEMVVELVLEVSMILITLFVPLVLTHILFLLLPKHLSRPYLQLTAIPTIVPSASLPRGYDCKEICRD
jgi:hypothetical protein